MGLYFLAEKENTRKTRRNKYHQGNNFSKRNIADNTNGFLYTKSRLMIGVRLSCYQPKQVHIL